MTNQDHNSRTPGPSLTHLSRSGIQERWGYKIPLSDVARIYLEELPPVIDSLGKASFTKPDFKMLQRKAHGIKGSFGMLGADRIVRLATELETAAANKDKKQTDQICIHLVGSLKIVERELTKFANAKA